MTSIVLPPYDKIQLILRKRLSSLPLHSYVVDVVVVVVCEIYHYLMMIMIHQHYYHMMLMMLMSLSLLS